MSDNTIGGTYGALSLPLAATGDSDLTGLDPARDILLDLFEAALNDELGVAWTFAAASFDGEDATLFGELPVGSKLPALVDLATMRQRKASYPLLAVSRKDEPQKQDEFTLWQNRIVSNWSIDYVLGPLEIGDQLKLADVLTAAGKILAKTVNEGGHKAYATTQTATVNPPLTAPVCAKQVFGTGVGLCGFSSLHITSFTAGAAAFVKDGPKYHALTMTLQTTELDSMADNAPAYQGANYTLGTGTDEGVIPDLLKLDTSIPLQPG